MPSSRAARADAELRLARFRKKSMLAVGVTALALLLFMEPGDAPAGTGGMGGLAEAQDTVTDLAAPPADTVGVDTAAAEDPAEVARQATGTLRQLARQLYAALPAIGIALALLLVAAVLARLVRLALRAALPSWERAQAIAALVAILIWLLALGAALSVLAGDARALVGSVGLFGLALSWALQAPIESFTGWLLNSFRSYYRIGDRIAVGDVFGDVARIDFLTTTVFEAGGPDKKVQAAQSTGALVTFPNSEVLRSNITNFTRDFPYVWDELTISVANESDLGEAIELLERTAHDVVGDTMEGAANEYASQLSRARLAWDVATRPEVYASSKESWTDLTIRYLVPAREMRKWSSRLLLAVTNALEAASDSVFTAYPRSQVQRIPPPDWAGHDQGEEGEP